MILSHLSRDLAPVRRQSQPGDTSVVGPRHKQADWARAMDIPPKRAMIGATHNREFQTVPLQVIFSIYHGLIGSNDERFPGLLACRNPVTVRRLPEPERGIAGRKIDGESAIGASRDDPDAGRLGSPAPKMP